MSRYVLPSVDALAKALQREHRKAKLHTVALYGRMPDVSLPRFQAMAKRMLDELEHGGFDPCDYQKFAARALASLGVR